MHPAIQSHHLRRTKQYHFHARTLGQASICLLDADLRCYPVHTKLRTVCLSFAQSLHELLSRHPDRHHETSRQRWQKPKEERTTVERGTKIRDTNACEMDDGDSIQQ